jgi:hypothetical protein
LPVVLFKERLRWSRIGIG